jgi:hypothetical protein
MHIAIPSKNRAGKCTTQKIIKDCTFYVSESEVHQYKQFYDNVVGMPKEVIGITKARNWILKNCNQKYVVMLDDDVKTAGYIKFNERNVKMIKVLEEDFWLNEFNNFFDMCLQLDYKIWGVKTESSSKSTYPYKPFLFKTYALGSIIGIINDGTYYFDESYIVKEDYELCLRHIKERGGILGVRYLFWENEHWSTDGGCKDYRTLSIERECIKKLIKQYPSMVASAKRENNEFAIKLAL